MTTAIDVSGLVKTFGKTRALDGLDLQATTGEVHGFLGPNGAGKTTTTRVLLGLLRADSGQATMLGGDPWRDAVALHRGRPSMACAAWSGIRRRWRSCSCGITATNSPARSCKRPNG